MRCRQWKAHSMRNTFIQELVSLAERHDHSALIVGDLGYSVVEPFADRFPERFINAGVAEQNMTGLAAGMASEGYHVFTYSIANFPTFRCAEQIRNDIDYHGLPVTVVSIGGGLAYGALGYSHHAVQDYALMRSFPNMLIAAPGDPMEVRACMRYLVTNPQPSYLRLGKTGEPTFHKDMINPTPGVWQCVVAPEVGSDSVYLCTGATMEYSMEQRVKQSEPRPGVYSLPLWGMQSKQSQRVQLGRFSKVTTLEDHLHDGGFGSWLLESAVGDGELVTRISMRALASVVCGMVGSQKELNLRGGLT